MCSISFALVELPMKVCRHVEHCTPTIRSVSVMLLKMMITTHDVGRRVEFAHVHWHTAECPAEVHTIRVWAAAFFFNWLSAGINN